MKSDLSAAATATLEAPGADAGLKIAAVDALLSAMNEGITLPTTAAWMIWSFWMTSPWSRGWRHANRLGENPNDRIRADAIAVLDRNDSGEALRDLAIDVLVGSAHAAHVDDRFVLGLIDRATSGDHAREAVRLIEAVHAARVIPAGTLKLVRDRWAASTVSVVREQAVAVANEIAEPDVEFIEQMLADPDAEVRAVIAFGVEREFPGRELAIGLIDARLRVEVHPRVRAALLRAQAALTEDLQGDGARRRRR